MSADRSHPHDPSRRSLRSLQGIPEPSPRGRGAAVISLLVHVGLIVLVLLPPFLAATLDQPLTSGGGGAGPAGGGGGGRRGSGLEPVRAERLVYLQIAPAPVPSAAVLPPIPPPTPPPVPVEKKPETPVPPASVPPAAEAPAAPAAAVSGTGAGTGTEGRGAGPGSGGGIGAGVGTGRGSATGPGTGGGTNEIFPPQVTNLALLPMPVPSKVRPYTMVAWFEVDERGKATLIAFNPSKDSGYNRRIRETLQEYRFRPAVRPDGTPVRDTVSVTVSVP